MDLIKYEQPNFNKLAERLDKFFEESLLNFNRGIAVPSGLEGSFGNLKKLRSNLYEDEKGENYILECELPWLKKEDIRLDLHENVLSIKGTKKTRTKQGEQTIRIEHSLSIPNDISAEHVSAQLENGILTLTLPKSAKSKGKTIQIQG